MITANWLRRRRLVAVLGGVMGLILPIATAMPGLAGLKRSPGALSLVTAPLFALVMPGYFVGAIAGVLLGGWGMLLAVIAANVAIWAAVALVFTSVHAHAKAWRVVLLLGWILLSVVSHVLSRWQS